MSRHEIKEPYPLINRYKIVVKNITETIVDQTITHPFPVIMEEFTFPTGEVIEIPSVLNKFTINKYRLKPLSSARNINSTICQFMNFVKLQIYNAEDEAFDKLKHEGISGLNFYHLATFLNYGSISGDSYSTFKQKERRLFELYQRLQAHNVIDLKWSYKKDDRYEKNYEYPFDKIEYQVNEPSKYGNKEEKETDLSDSDINLLLRLCRIYYPEILFGVAICMYGGLRQGELVNLRLSDIKLFDDKNIMMADIKDRPELFEGRSIIANGVKRKRRQVLLNDNGLLYEYYHNHTIIRMSIVESKGIKSPALLLDRNGNAMTGLTYMQKFLKLKKKFLEYKEQNSYHEYIQFSELKWGTHICRGIFTNLCIRRGYARTLEELMHLRGDKSTKSSEPYWNQHTISKITQQSLDVITSCKKYRDKLEKEEAYYYE